MSDTFTAADLEPSDEERQRARRALVDRVAAILAAIAAGFVPGGLVALGACAAPFVFRMTPAPMSGDAMGAAFARFDRIALGCAGVVLLAEIARTYVGRARARTPLARVRRLAAVALAGAIAYGGMVVSPAILELHRTGVSRNVGEAGARLEAVHQRASTLGKVEALLAAALVAMHVLTLPRPRPDDDEEEAAAPLPPGPRG